MSSEQLADGVNPLDAELAATWDILKGYSGRDTDLGIGRRFGGASMAYSLRDIGAMNGRVVKARRDVDGQGSDPEEDFSANQVQDGTLEKWINGELESTLPADVATAAAAYSLRKVKASYSGDAVRIRRSSDDIEVDVAFDSDGKVSASSAITNIAEEGGESGQTTDTTLGDFINGTDAFVHTWYDQAGSNNAVQATAANQPKIASSGALLTDGITFDGSNDFLQTSTQVLTGTETGANSMYAVIKQTSGDAGYICGSAASPDGASNQIGQSLYSASNDKIVLTSGNDATATGALDTITRIEGSNYLVSSNYSNNNTDTLHSNSNSNGYANGSSAYDFNAGDRFTIGARKDSTSAAEVLFDGSMKEIIAYDSDQTNNRFKIESNINNYYGLYNDANEMSEAFRATAGTLTNESKDGFDLAVGTPTAYVGFEFNEKIASGDSVFISFNLDLTGGSGGDATPIMRLTKTTLDGTDSSNFINPSDLSQGFNSFELTSSDNDAKFFAISEGDDNVNISISDFKISRIARNGFVETWYDQSGNGFDLKSQSADTQPFIVNNGGFTGGVYSPSRLNNSTKQYLEISDPDFDSTNITSSKFGWLAVMANMEENDGSQAGGVILGNTRNTQSFPAGAIGLTLSDTNPNGRMFVTNLKTSSTGDFIGAVDNDDLFTSETIGTAVVDGSSLSTFLNGTTGSGTFTDLTLTSDVHFKIFQASDAANNPYYQNAAQGFIKELMFMQGDTIDDIATIRNEVNNHYNIF